MGFRFSKRITLMPGLRLNLGLGGASLSAGPRGASVTVGKRGVYGNVGLPGSGLSYRTRLDKPGQRSPRRGQAEHPDIPVPDAFKYRFVADTVEYLDRDEKPLADPEIQAVKDAYRDQLRPILETRVAALNDNREALSRAHLATPWPRLPDEPPRLAASPFDLPKPVRSPNSEDPDAFAEQLSAWQVARAAHGRQAGPRVDLDAVAQPILKRLATIPWPRETHIRLDLDESGRILLIAVDLPEPDDMPTVKYDVSAKDLSIRAKPLSSNAVACLYADHVHSVLFRLVGEAFAAEASFTTLKLAAYRQEVSPATGRVEDVWILAGEISRSAWLGIDFANLNAVYPRETFAALGVSRRMSAGGRFRAIEVDNEMREVSGHE